MENEYKTPAYEGRTTPICTPEVDGQLTRIVVAVSGMPAEVRGTSRKPTRDEVIRAYS